MSEEEREPQKDETGRPLKFDNPEHLERMIDNYFKEGCAKKIVIIKDNPIELPIPTVTGLALYLGFASRQSFYDYENRDKFSYTIKKARTFIEKHYEEMLQVGNTTGAIFALKNLGWKDKTENVNKNINYNSSEMSKDEVKDISDKLEEEF